MAEWEIWRQDDNGNRYRVSGHGDRIEALSRVLTWDSGPVHKQTYWVAGPTEPVLRTNRDLYQRLVAEGRGMNAAGRTLDEFLRAWYRVSQPLAGTAELEPDTVAAMVVAAAGVEPSPIRPAWRTMSFDGIAEPVSYADFEAVVLSQIADLADFADEGPFDEYASLGVDAPRPPGVVRATDTRWYNVDPAGYLECGVAGWLGDWDSVSGRGVRPLGAVTWADLTELMICGQVYE